MREMLAPIFGESGAVVAQFLLLLILVLVVVWLGYWLFYRFGGFHLGGRGRSRLPRLAVIDTMPIDHLHRLVLIRRDNVEHLLLIGKTADLVVESSIVRTAPAGARPRPAQGPRTQPQQPQKNAPARVQPDAVRPPQPAPQHTPQIPQPPQPPARPAEATAPAEPIPFPQARRPQARPASQFAEARPARVASDDETATPETIPQRRAVMGGAAASAPGAVAIAAGGAAQMVSASAHFEEPTHPTKIDSVFSLADALDEIADEPATASGVTEADVAEMTTRQTEPMGFEPPPQTTAKQPATLVRPQVEAETAETQAETAPKIASDDTATDNREPEDSDEDSAATVSNLEEEMARLLGQITSKREP